VSPGSDIRLLAGIVPGRAMPLARHLAVHGDVPAEEATTRLLEDLSASGLRGRGGAAFPAAIKAGAVSGRRRPLIVVNGSEGEPMSAKDRLLLTRAPHLVIDGALLTARAVGAREVTVAAPAGVLTHVAAALDERRALGRPRAKLRLEASAVGYVSGEETALIAHLDGRPALPRTKPPLPVERGLRGRPTLVHNVETMAHVALIARHGPQWFRQVGTHQHPGTTLVTVSGAVEQPGVYEVALGIPIREIVARARGAAASTRAVLVGGYFGAWLDRDGGDLTFDDPSLRAIGAGVGAGVVVALGTAACPVAETARLARWMSDESAGQCGPCVFGLSGLADVLERFATGRTWPDDVDRLRRWTSLVRGRGACHHPDGVARMVASATRAFGRELADHARRGPCSACASPPTLATPGSGAVAA
jgi:NADH:ubiquinone oxidoreductase subunit F (NADH-binding)